MTEDRRDAKFMLGLFLGGLLGAIVIFLIGTKEGKKTGKLLEEKSKNFFDQLKEKAVDIEEQGKSLVEETEEVKQNIIETLEEKKDSLSEEVVEKLDTALAHIEAIQERGRENTATLRKRLFKNIPKKG